nr:MAG TPA: hypothetical protein [Caudoviricetes sp.]
MPYHPIQGKPESLPLPRPVDRQGWITTATGCVILNITLKF